MSEKHVSSRRNTEHPKKSEPTVDEKEQRSDIRTNRELCSICFI